MAETLQLQKSKKKEKLGELADFWKKIKLKDESKKLTMFLALLGGAVVGRVALQAVPSVEPIIPFAILAGLIFGMKEGFTLGGGAYIISNFFIWGLQGPWTIFQAIGGALAGVLGGAYGKVRKPKQFDLITLTIVGTVMFEFVMNLTGPLMGIGLFVGLLSIPIYFLTSLPFTAIHIASNIVFARLMYPLLKLRRNEDELKIVSVRRVAGDGDTNYRMYRGKP
ncbi:MAG: hypothetical protein ABID38_06325 [Candidatus Diapherotrites archaeon]